MFPRRIHPKVMLLLRDGNNLVYVSAVTSWEIEIKRALGKLKAPPDLGEQVSSNSFEELPERVAHTLGIRALPPLHQDPFDRLLCAQALAENLTLVTTDK